MEDAAKVREKVTNTAEEQLSHLSSKYKMIIEDGLLYMADGVVVFDPNVRRFRLETRYRIKQLPKWCWFPGPWNLYPPFRGFVKTTATQLIGQLNAKVDQVKFEFLLEKLNKTWSTMKKIMVAFLCAMASKGTNVRMTGGLN